MIWSHNKGITEIVKSEIVKSEIVKSKIVKYHAFKRDERKSYDFDLFFVTFFPLKHDFTTWTEKGLPQSKRERETEHISLEFEAPPGFQRRKPLHHRLRD